MLTFRVRGSKVANFYTLPVLNAPRSRDPLEYRPDLYIWENYNHGTTEIVKYFDDIYTAVTIQCTRVTDRQPDVRIWYSREAL